MTAISQSIKNNALYGERLNSVEYFIVEAFLTIDEELWGIDNATQIHKQMFKLFVSECLND